MCDFCREFSFDYTTEGHRSDDKPLAQWDWWPILTCQQPNNKISFHYKGDDGMRIVDKWLADYGHTTNGLMDL